MAITACQYHNIIYLTFLKHTSLPDISRITCILPFYRHHQRIHLILLYTECIYVTVIENHFKLKQLNYIMHYH